MKFKGRNEVSNKMKKIILKNLKVNKIIDLEPFYNTGLNIIKFTYEIF